MNESTQLGANIRRTREAAALTQQELAHRCDLDPGEISRLERGVRDPRLSTIAKIARGLRVPASELLAGVG